jgi:23S rRNA (uracil1939-C5)-methyltransferase
MSRRQRKRLPEGEFEASVESLSHDGRGVAHIDGKAIFIDGALPGENIKFQYVSRRRRFDEGRATEIMIASADRVEPRCPHATICGGCSLQHLSASAQVEAKQKILVEQFQHLAKLEIPSLLPPLVSEPWGYRRKARLGVKYVRKKGKVLVGFREKRAPYLAELSGCDVLHASVGQHIETLKNFIGGLDAYQHIPQIEVSCGDTQTALIFRHLDPLSESDIEKLIHFAKEQDYCVYLQPAGPDSVTALWPADPHLSYRLPDYQLELEFLPNDFIQVNAELNRKMINQALELLDIQPGERLLDLFCGIGNFSLPLARRGAHVVGIEGDAALVQRARDNALRNGITATEFHTGDLTQGAQSFLPAEASFDKILLDPPRSGAFEVVQAIRKLNARLVLYVSCNIATLARDAEELVNNQGYRLVSAGIMDMFPHTTHAESMALFERVK